MLSREKVPEGTFGFSRGSEACALWYEVWSLVVCQDSVSAWRQV